MKATVVKRVSFDAAHYLPNYPGKCSNIHGHHWVVEVGVSGEVGEDGMVVDFSTLKGSLQPIIDNLDHHLVNSVIPNPTAENIAIYIRDWLTRWATGKEAFELEFVRVWETEDSYAEVRWGRE